MLNLPWEIVNESDFRYLNVDNKGFMKGYFNRQKKVDKEKPKEVK